MDKLVSNIQQQLADRKPFIRMRSRNFVKLAQPKNPSEDSNDPVERSMARSVRKLHTAAGRLAHSEKMYVNRAVAERLVGSAASVQTVNTGSGKGDKQEKSGKA